MIIWRIYCLLFDHSVGKSNFKIERNVLISEISLFCLLLSIFFRGTKFFIFFPTALMGVRFQFVLIITSFVLSLLASRTLPRLTFLVTSGIVSAVLFNILIAQKANLEYLFYMALALMSLFVWSAIMKFISLKTITNFLSWALILIETLAILEITYGVAFFHEKFPYVYRSTFNRSFLFQFNPNNLSMLIAMTLIYLVIMNIRLTSILLLSLGALFIMFSNDSKLSIISTFSVLAIYMARNAKSKFWTISIVFSTAIVLIASVTSIRTTVLSFAESFFHSLSLQRYLDPRFGIYSDSLASSVENIFGIGFGNADYFLMTNTHSFLLQIIVEFGVLGYSFWFLYYALVGVSTFIARHKMTSYALGIFLLYIPLFSSQVSRMLTDIPIMIIWMLSIATLVYRCRRNSS